MMVLLAALFATLSHGHMNRGLEAVVHVAKFLGPHSCPNLIIAGAFDGQPLAGDGDLNEASEESKEVEL